MKRKLDSEPVRKRHQPISGTRSCLPSQLDKYMCWTKLLPVSLHYCWLCFLFFRFACFFFIYISRVPNQNGVSLLYIMLTLNNTTVWGFPTRIYMTGGRKVNTKQNLLASFSGALFNWMGCVVIWWWSNSSWTSWDYFGVKLGESREITAVLLTASQEKHFHIDMHWDI